MELEHISHEHPLILSNKNYGDGEKIACNGCQEVISGFSYNCAECRFFLHKLCAELPEEMNHPNHPNHVLTLGESLSGRLCNVCGERFYGFSYCCSVACNFVVDIRCAVRGKTVEHKCHEHPLSPVLTPASFECRACRTTRRDVSYICNTCTFWIHEDCASFPTTIKLSLHVHPLTLLYSFPIEYEELKHRCGICKEELDRSFWNYHCGRCSYFVHASCSTTIKESKVVVRVEDLDDEVNSIHLPHESDGLVAQFMKRISLRGNKQQREAKLYHFCHGHLLSLFDKHKNGEVCYGCGDPISAPFYSCRLCSDDFFLHTWCAELPKILQHPCHPHPLILTDNPGRREFFMCRGCELFSNRFLYQCRKCNFYLDVKCASLPRSIVHEVHDHEHHPLLLRDTSIKVSCIACDRREGMFSFGCGTCNFNLHYRCALLPRTFKHRYDEHSFTLTYAPVQDGSEEYYCEFCEEEINPKWWFYHCVICDQSACVECTYKEEERKIQISSSDNGDHPHPWPDPHEDDHCNVLKSRSDQSVQPVKLSPGSRSKPILVQNSLKLSKSEVKPQIFHLNR